MKKKIFKGDIFTEKNLTIKRPGNGISPMRWKKILGKKAKQNFAEDEIIKLWKKIYVLFQQQEPTSIYKKSYY